MACFIVSLVAFLAGCWFRDGWDAWCVELVFCGKNIHFFLGKTQTSRMYIQTRTQRVVVEFLFAFLFTLSPHYSFSLLRNCCVDYGIILMVSFLLNSTLIVLPSSTTNPISTTTILLTNNIKHIGITSRLCVLLSFSFSAVFLSLCAMLLRNTAE